MYHINFGYALLVSRATRKQKQDKASWSYRPGDSALIVLCQRSATRAVVDVDGIGYSVIRLKGDTVLVVLCVAIEWDSD